MYETRSKHKFLNIYHYYAVLIIFYTNIHSFLEFLLRVQPIDHKLKNEHFLICTLVTVDFEDLVVQTETQKPKMFKYKYLIYFLFFHIGLYILCLKLYDYVY